MTGLACPFMARRDSDPGKASGSKCPFGFMFSGAKSSREHPAVTSGDGKQWPADTASSRKSAAAQEQAICPYGFSTTSTSSLGGSSTQDPSPQAAPCPYGFSSNSNQGVSAHEKPTSQDETPAAACPYGFSSNNTGPALSSLHCVLCKQWMHDAVQIKPCSHKFCGYCISRYQDCPVCGSDVAGADADEETNKLVTQLLAAHVHLAQQTQQAGASSDDLTRGKVSSPTTLTPTTLPPLMPGMAPSTSSSFLLHLGVQALRGGNPAAALYRLEACKIELLQDKGLANHQPPTDQQQQQCEPASAATTRTGQQQTGNDRCRRLEQLLQRSLPCSSVCGSAITLDLPPCCGELSTTLQVLPPSNLSSSLACQLGAVYGTQGDAARQLGAMGTAVALYTAGAACLNGAADEGDDEAAHALSVSLNKLGDVHYLTQNMAAAHEAYLAGLDVRQDRLHRAMTGSLLREPGEGKTVRERGLTQGDAWNLTGLSTSCVAQALDCAASLIKVADVHSAVGDVAAALTACDKAQTLILQCEALLAEKPGATGAQEGRGEVDVGLVRCRQLQDVLRGVKGSLAGQA